MEPFRVMRKFLFLILMLACAPAFSYSVSGGRLYDATGQEIQLRGLNWFGAETEIHVVNGLWARGYKDMIAQMKSLGFNAVRLPFCPTTLDNVAITEGIVYGYNSDLQGKGSLEIYDAIVNELNAQGFYILLDHHRPDCVAISELWYTSTYSEQQWIDDLLFVANRYKNVPGVIGLDLKNEPHGASTWGTGNSSTDWNLAAERASVQVLQAAPHWLMFVEGVTENFVNGSPVCSQAWGHFYGENLEATNCTGLNIATDRLVYAPHTYGPDVYSMDYFSDPTYPSNMPAIWEKFFGHLSPAHAVVLGEWGGKYGEGDSRDVAWQNQLVDWLISKQMTSQFYWSWNPNSGDTGGILRDDWTTVREDKMELLNRLWSGYDGGKPPADDPVDTSEPPVGTITANYPKLLTTLVMTSDDGDNYCGSMTVTNTHTSKSLKWKVKFEIVGTLESYSGGKLTQTGTVVEAIGPSDDRYLDPGESAMFSFCGQRSGTLDDGGGSDTSTAPFTTPVPTNAAITVTTAMASDNGSQWCGSVTLLNTHASSTLTWAVNFTLQGSLTSSYNATFAYSGSNVTATGAAWNTKLMPNQSTTFEMCGVR